jgi:hypothetical protein
VDRKKITYKIKINKDVWQKTNGNARNKKKQAKKKKQKTKTQ